MRQPDTGICSFVPEKSSLPLTHIQRLHSKGPVSLQGKRNLKVYIKRFPIPDVTFCAHTKLFLPLPENVSLLAEHQFLLPTSVYLVSGLSN